MRKILFICKTGHGYGSESQRRSSGLVNSTSFIAEALKRRGVHCKVAEAIDNNCIDRLVSEYRPDTVIIEALWVVPEKFGILKRLHPRVKWYIHLHSNIPFLAQEGIATDWLFRYAEAGVGIIANCERAYSALKEMIGGDIRLLPNIYFARPTSFPRQLPIKGILYVSCFGAIRPMKNHLTQALAAIEYARETERGLCFYINGTRAETGGEAILKSLRNLFKANGYAELIESPWMDHRDFIHVQGFMDISLQVSLSETFNIVTADAVSMGTPIVVSPEISWASSWNYADPASTEDIKRVMRRVEGNRYLARWNQFLLERHSAKALQSWIAFAKERALV